MPWEKQFDRDEALGLAERTFWEGGYQGTSLETLLLRMGIQKGSFYATFGSKREALMESLNRYIRDRFASFGQLEHNHPPLRALALHLDAVYRESCEDGAAGCFLLNIALELAPADNQIRDLTRQTLRDQECYYERLLRTAMEQGELPVDFDSASTARAILSMVLGMRVMARASLPQSTIQAVRDQATALFQRPV